jgi:hypothetical protein
MYAAHAPSAIAVPPIRCRTSALISPTSSINVNSGSMIEIKSQPVRWREIGQSNCVP